DNWRWAGVPFYIRTGKALARKGTEIVITLKPVPHLAFEQQGSLGVHPNQLILAVQPNEGVSMSLMAKIPGARMRVRPVNMEFLYGTSFLSQSPEAYERLILDTMRGDATLFARDDEVKGEIANRLERVGRYHPSRTILCAVERGRTTIDAVAQVTARETEIGFGVATEQIEIDIGPQHLAALDAIVDPLIISDLTSVAWAPHGHEQGIDALRRLIQVVLIDSAQELHARNAIRRAA